MQCGIVGDLITLSQQVIGKLAEEIIKIQLHEEKQSKWAHFCSSSGTKVSPSLVYFYISNRCNRVANNNLKSISIKRSKPCHATMGNLDRNVLLTWFICNPKLERTGE